MNKNADAKDIQRLVERAGWNGIFEEMAEERIGEVGHALFEKV